MSVKEERLRNVLSHVAATCCMKNWKFKRGEISEAIENYIGYLIPVTVIGVCGDTRKEIVQQAYVKLPALEDSVRAFSGYQWDTEVYVYENLVPLWKRISNLKLDELIPSCYYADATTNDQVLVLKDMRYEGFHKYPERFLDFEHIMVSLKSLAQFHALSIIMKNNRIELDAYVLRPYTDTWPAELNTALKSSLRAHAQLFKGSKCEDFFRSTITKYEDILMQSTSNAKCLVYGHGDYWKENIMYKYENKKPVQACIFDFQCCRLMSPAHDFLYFILNCSNATVRRLHFTHFVTEYYSCFKNTLFDNAIQIENFYTIEDFESDLSIVAPLCFVRICMGFSLWLGFETESVLIKKGSSEQDSSKYKENLKCLKEILTDAMYDLCDNKFITL